jgi:hypothetical protein
MAAPLSPTEPLPEVITPLVGRACKAKIAELNISKVILQEAIAACWAIRIVLILKEFILSLYGQLIGDFWLNNTFDNVCTVDII